MYLVANVLVGLIAVEHIYILVLEMFLWQKPRGLKAFGLTPEKAALTVDLAKNQGLYNGFLAAGLIYALLVTNPVAAFHFKLFFSACVAVAGIYGGATVAKKIFFIQGVPGLATLTAVLLAGSL
jgi:putative membrane protein